MELSPFLSPVFLALYAEVHYSLRLGFSLVRSNHPEIIADLPWRVEPQRPVPILCLIKDAHQYPIQLDQIVVTAAGRGTGRWRKEFPLGGQMVKEKFWHRILEIPRRHLPDGSVDIDVLFKGRRDGRPFRCHNDNYRRLSHRPLRTTLAAESLPGMPHWYPGEPHAHTSFTDDQVEFGAPPEATAAMAQAMGFRWMALTDHSYDLDDLPENHLAQDPTLRKWNQLKDIIDRLNHVHLDFTTLLGEEVSCGNARRRNVHLLAFGVPLFIPGSGDSAERWLHSGPTLSIRQVVDRVRRSGGVAYAAHPEESGTLMERLLLRRGPWSRGDYAQPGLSGLQIWNGRRDDGLWRGRERWLSLLLKGYGLGLIGGNDAHGNFNRFRQLRMPLLSLRESQDQIFGRVHTYLLCPHPPDQKQLLGALRRGAAVVTDGPLVTFTLSNSKGPSANIGECLTGEDFIVGISARSSSEFGALERIDLFVGQIGGKERRIRSYRRGRDFTNQYGVDLKDSLTGMGKKAYVRIEAESSRGTRTWLAITNPIWLNFVPQAKRDDECPGSDEDGAARRS